MKFDYAISIPNSLNSNVSSALIFNGLNFSDWTEQVLFHLNVLDLDLTILEKNPTTIIDSSSIEDKVHYKAWERSNKLSLHEQTTLR